MFSLHVACQAQCIVPGFKTHLSHYLRVLTEEQMMNALVKFGAVAIVVNAQAWPQSFTTQVMTCPPVTGPTDVNLDHVVVVVGWTPCEVSERGWGGEMGRGGGIAWEVKDSLQFAGRSILEAMGVSKSLATTTSRAAHP